MSNSKPKHTPGICSICTKQIYDHFGVMLCNECRDKLPPLFLTAPELLEALEVALETLLEQPELVGDADMSMRTMKAAIAKARGES